MHHHDCPCPPVHHCPTDYVTPQHYHTDDVAPHHCHTDDVAPPMFFGPTTMFSWPTATTSSRTYSDNARQNAVRVDVPPPSTTDDPSCEDTPCGKCALGIVWLFWGIIIALIIYAIKK